MATVLVDNYRSQLKMAHEWLDGTVEGMTNEQANYQPDGRAMSAGAHYSHHMQGMDGVFNGMLKGSAPLMAGEYAGKIGTETPAPQGDWSDWARSTAVDIEMARAYGKAVLESVDAWLAEQTDADITKDIDLSVFHMGDQPMTVLIDLMLLDTVAHCGEISAVKGVQGLQGYPF